MCWAKVVRKDPAGAGMRTKCVASCPGLPTPPPAPTLHPTPTPPMDAALRGRGSPGEVRASPAPLGRGESDGAEGAGRWWRGADDHCIWGETVFGKLDT